MKWYQFEVNKMKYLIVYVLCLLSFNVYAKPESYYQNKWCQGEIEFVLPDKARVDCLTKDYAIEVDFAQKWAEAIGQSLYYANETGKKPGILLIVGPDDYRYIRRLMVALEGLEVRVWFINKD